MVRVLLLLSFSTTLACNRPVPFVVAPAAPESDARLIARDRGVAYLLAKQSADGAWRSDVYGHHRNGDALAPLVLVALQQVPQSSEINAAIERGIAFMRRYLKGDTIDADATMHYPVYTASLMAKVLSDPRQAKHLKTRDVWVKLLLDWQMTDENGWEEKDWQFGGWGYAAVRPRKPGDGPIPEALEANISATAYATEALRAAGLDGKQPVFGKAMIFVNRCQNFATDRPELDDGGFFFTPGDLFRNKAGLSSKPDEKPRYLSYGSATADGRRCFHACSTANKRLQQLEIWFDRYFPVPLEGQTFNHHGHFAEDRAPDRNAASYYYAASFIEGSADRDFSERCRWVQTEIAKRQRDDGSWQNERSTVREDDPLLATTLAVMALR